MKKILAFSLVLLFLFPTSSFAAGDFVVHEVYDPQGLITKSLYYNSSADSIHLNISGQKAVKVSYTSYTDNTFSEVAVSKSYTPDKYGWQYFTGMGFNCNVPYVGELYDSSGNVLVRAKVTVSGLVDPVCNSESGGEDMGGGEKTCDSCAVFNCPGWGEHLGKLDDIKNAIPPAPNWNQVSQTFSDAIVPRLVSETRTMLSELLGGAPTPPPSLPDLPPMKVHDFENKKPDMQETPDFKGFTENEVKKAAPVIPFEEDPTGGFSLGVDPVNNLPDVVPGGDPGIYKRDPKELPATYPGKPKEAEIDMGGAPTPSDGGGTPPKPGDGGGTPPKPGDSVPLPGKPDDGGLPTKENYMPKPGGG